MFMSVHTWLEVSTTEKQKISSPISVTRLHNTSVLQTSELDTIMVMVTKHRIIRTKDCNLNIQQA